MFELLVFGTLWFYLLWIVASAIIIACVENDLPGRALLTLLVVGALCYVFGHGETWSAIQYALSNPIVCFLYLVAYFVAGTLWCFVK